MPQSTISGGRVWYRNHATHVRDFPISIDVEALRQLAASAEVAEHRSEIQDMVGDRKLILRIDRIEPSKNIVRGFLAFEEMLELYPEHRGKVQFLALLVPSRLDVEEYQALSGRTDGHGRAGQRHLWRQRVGTGAGARRRQLSAGGGCHAVVRRAAGQRHRRRHEPGGQRRPIVNRRDGVLILSERAGARQQLEPGALIISPCDVYATAEALHQALAMPAKSARTAPSGCAGWSSGRTSPPGSAASWRRSPNWSL